MVGTNTWFLKLETGKTRGSDANRVVEVAVHI